MKYTRFEDLPVCNAAIDLADKTFALCENKMLDFQGEMRNQRFSQDNLRFKEKYHWSLVIGHWSFGYV